MRCDLGHAGSSRAERTVACTTNHQKKGREDAKGMNGKPIQQTIVKRSVGGRARTERVWRPRPTPAREAAYRRLAAAILRLDVATLAGGLISGPRPPAHAPQLAHPRP